jgi:hypothetical protein
MAVGGLEYICPCLVMIYYQKLLVTQISLYSTDLICILFSVMTLSEFSEPGHIVDLNASELSNPHNI